MSDRPRVEWRSDPDAPGRKVGRLVCPDCPGLDATVHGGREGARALLDHINGHGKGQA